MATSTTTPASTQMPGPLAGVVLLAKFLERAIEQGCNRLDLLRGDEPYKYEWGAVDEPIQRILVRRRNSG